MSVTSGLRGVARWALKGPIYLYRWTLKPYVGWQCRHLPTCSEYGLEAIDRNGAWRGGWLTLSRLSRCRPGGTDGYDPVPDIAAKRHPFAPWRYGLWRQSHRMVADTFGQGNERRNRTDDDTAARSS